jgi:hypothetical protein
MRNLDLVLLDRKNFKEFSYTYFKENLGESDIVPVK